MPKTKQSWFVYLLECANGKLYTGITNDLEKRFYKHCAGKGAVFTRLNPPSHMVAANPCKDRSEATKLEYAIKQLTAENKRQAASRWKLKKNLPKSAWGIS